jgi:translation initiation factor 2 subunit 3
MEELEFSITRSFDINKPGIFPKDLKGGVVGGSLISGELKVGDEIEIRPGRLRFDQSKNQWFAKPFISQVNTLQSEKSSLESIIPGGLMAIGLDLDSFFTKNDGLKGSILGLKGKLPKIYSTLTLETELKLKDSHLYHLQIGANSVKGKYQQKTKNFLLTQPVCVDETKKILICDKIDGILTILDLGIFVDGAEVILV